MSTTGFQLGDKQAYFVETYRLDANATGVAAPWISARPGVAAVVGAVGKSLQVSGAHRSRLIFFLSDTRGGGYMTVDGLRYNADMGGSRGDPMLSYAIMDENSLFVDEPVIEAFDGAVVEIQVQREA